MSTWNIGKKCKQIFSFFILVASEGLYCIIYSPYNYIVLWSTSYIQKAHHIILFFSPSLLEVAALETFNGDILQLFLSCFTSNPELISSSVNRVCRLFLHFRLSLSRPVFERHVCVDPFFRHVCVDHNRQALAQARAQTTLHFFHLFSFF